MDEKHSIVFLQNISKSILKFWKKREKSVSLKYVRRYQKHENNLINIQFWKFKLFCPYIWYTGTWKIPMCLDTNRLLSFLHFYLVRPSSHEPILRLMPESALSAPKEKKLTGRQWFESGRASAVLKSEQFLPLVWMHEIFNMLSIASWFFFPKDQYGWIKYVIVKTRGAFYSCRKAQDQLPKDLMWKMRKTLTLMMRTLKVKFWLSSELLNMGGLMFKPHRN